MGGNPSGFSSSPQLPVERVSWDDVQEFLRRLNVKTGKFYRLPTEAEWEYAARGGNQSKGYKYSGSNSIDEVAWYDDNANKQTHLVGTKKPNELGIYDMSGNVLEWCNDWHDNYSSSSQANPTGAATGSYREPRGGSWVNGASGCRVSARDYYFPPESRRNNIGFRLVLPL
jgi:formylglycine-generating enzyme required for sulfatase activity